MVLNLFPLLDSLFSGVFAFSRLNSVKRTQIRHHSLVPGWAKEMTYIAQDSRSEKPAVNGPGQKGGIKIEE
jgi:hypothetical protein